MKKIAKFSVAALVAFGHFSNDMFAQTNRAVVHFEPHQLNQAELVLPDNQKLWKGTTLSVLPIQPKGSFTAYSIVWESKGWESKTDQIVAIFNGQNDSLFTIPIHPDGHADQSKRQHISQLYFLENQATKFRLHFKGKHKIENIAVHFFDPGPSQPSTIGSPQPPQTSIPPNLHTSSTCSCPQPPFEGRLGWCPDGSCPTDATPGFVPDPTHVIIHHTAGTNVSSDWAAVVRSIWDFHVNTNGWDDIGYNWLIDPDGILYEGRGDGRLGAHFCAQNGNTTGICVMGDFTSIEPTPAALESLAKFLAWETCDENIDPLGTSFHNSSGLTLANVSGHRDGCSTSCPGDKFYPLLPNMRQATQENIDTGCEVEALTAPTVLAITFVSHDEIGLKWLDNSADESGYVIERSDNVDNNFSSIIQLPANATTFSDNGVSPNNTYFYRVRAQQGSTFSDYSNVAVAITSVSSTMTQLHGGMLSISPNPTNGQLLLSIENQWIGETEIAVFDGLGRMVVPAFYEVKQNEAQAIQLDLGQMPAGLYWVKMVQGGDAGWIKIMKN